MEPKVLNEGDTETIGGDSNESVVKMGSAHHRIFEVIWGRVIGIGLLHVGAIYGVYLLVTSAKIYTGMFAFIIFFMSQIGVTAGAHRLWSHRSYKATLPLQILLMTFHTTTLQFSIIWWARDHRVHHKYSDTDADPHNASRGFFFSHIGWLLCKKHPEVSAKGKEIDISDLENDPVLRFQKKHYNILVTIFCFILPILVPVFLWNETIKNAWFIAFVLRWVVTMNILNSVNSFAHLYGNRPYDRSIKPAENKLLAILMLGDGWHNFHHAFPWDYKTGELGNINFTTAFIDFMAKIGWAYDLKTGATELVKRRVERTGDGTHHIWGKTDEDENKASR